MRFFLLPILTCSNLCFGMTVTLTNSDFCPLTVTIAGVNKNDGNRYPVTISLEAATQSGPSQGSITIPIDMLPSVSTQPGYFEIEWLTTTTPATCYGQGSIPIGPDITYDSRFFLGKGTCNPTGYGQPPGQGRGCAGPSK